MHCGILHDMPYSDESYISSQDYSLYFFPIFHLCSFMVGWGLAFGFGVGVFSCCGLGPVLWGLLGLFGV